MDDPELFDEIMGRPATERKGAIDRACADDPERAQRMWALVQVATEAEADLNFTPEATTSLSKGETFGRYCIVSLLGEGAFGQVYDALDLELERRVALKLLHADRIRSDSDDRRFQREARVLARIDHPNVVRVYDAGVQGGRRYLAMDRLQGSSLRAWVRASASQLRWSAVLDRLLPAAQGLAAAHDAGIVHRDFKPENVIFDEAKQRVVVVDFGIARAGHSEEVTTQPGISSTARRGDSTASILGTPGYMAPEQAHGEATAKSDQFAFCRVVLEALGGAPRTMLPTSSATDGAFEEEGVRAPRWLRRALARGTHHDPAQRHPDMPALIEALTVHQRRGRWTLSVLLLAGVLAPTAYAAGGPTPDPCSVWNAGTAEEALAPHWDLLESRATSGPAAALVAELRRRSEGDVQRWASARTQSCRQHSAGLVDDVTAEARDHCFARWRNRLRRRVVWAAEQPDAAASPRLSELFEADPERCAHVRPVGAQPETLPPQTAQALDERIDDAESLWVLGRYAQSHDVAQLALEQARAAGHESFRAEALHRLGVLAARSGDAEGAASTLLEALELAQRQGQDELQFEVLYHLAETHVVAGRSDAAAPLVALLRAQLARMAERPRRRAEVTMLEGHLALSKGDRVGARTAYWTAAEQFSAVDGGELGRAAARQQLAELMSVDGEDSDAVALSELAFEERVAALGSAEHPLVVDARLRVAGVRLRAAKRAVSASERGVHVAAARTHAAAARSMAESVYGTLSKPFVRALTLRVRVGLVDEKVDPAVAQDAAQLVHTLEMLTTETSLSRPHRLQALRAARNVQHARADWVGAQATSEKLVALQRETQSSASASERDDELALISYMAQNGALEAAQRQLYSHRARFLSSFSSDQAYLTQLDRLSRSISRSRESELQ